MVDMFPPHTQDIKNGNKKYNKTHPEKESSSSLFWYNQNDNKSNKNNTWEVVKNIKYDIIGLMKMINQFEK